MILPLLPPITAISSKSILTIIISNSSSSITSISGISIMIIISWVRKLQQSTVKATITEVDPAIEYQLWDARQCLQNEDDDICPTHPPFKAAVRTRWNHECQRYPKTILWMRTVGRGELKSLSKVTQSRFKVRPSFSFYLAHGIASSVHLKNHHDGYISIYNCTYTIFMMVI